MNLRKKLAASAFALLASVLFVACGGGGSSAPPISGGTGTGSSTSTSSGGSSTSSSSGGAVATSYSMTYVAKDSNNATFDTVASALTLGKSVNVTVTLKNAQGAVVPGHLITFSVDDTANAAVSPAKRQTDNNGNATATVSVTNAAANGTFTLTIQDSVAGVAQTVLFNMNVSNSSATAGAPAYISYIGADATRLFINNPANPPGQGAIRETDVRFKVTDSNRNAVGAGVRVYFNSVDTTSNGVSGGVTLTPFADTDASGIVTAHVKAGADPITFFVRANLAGSTTMFDSGDQFYVTGGLPHWSKFSIGFPTENACGETVHTYPCSFTVYLGDINGQAVADGTIVQFMSMTGTIAGVNNTGTCVTSNSQCTAAYNPGSNEISRGNNMRQITAYVQGDPQFSATSPTHATTVNYYVGPTTMNITDPWVDPVNNPSPQSKAVPVAAGSTYIRADLQCTFLKGGLCSTPTVP